MYNDMLDTMTDMNGWMMWGCVVRNVVHEKIRKMFPDTSFLDCMYDLIARLLIIGIRSVL